MPDGAEVCHGSAVPMLLLRNAVLEALASILSLPPTKSKWYSYDASRARPTSWQLRRQRGIAPKQRIAIARFSVGGPGLTV